MWLYNNKEFTSENIENFIGFVYLITDESNNKKYIGKKNFFSTIRKAPLKGKKRKRTIISESDWKEYYSSSEEIKKLVDNGEKSFKREILRLCTSKGEMSYFEAKLQFQYDVILRDDYYNSYIGCRINRNHLKIKLDSYK